MATGSFEDFEQDLEVLLREQQHQPGGRAAALDRQRELNLFRSGSAPPTVDGSRAAARNVLGLGAVERDVSLSGEALRSHPAYAQNYYSNENFSPSIPPTVLSREGRRVARSVLGGIGDGRSMRREEGEGQESGLLYPSQAGMLMSGRQESMEWLGRRGSDLMGLEDVGIGARRRNSLEALQRDFGHSNSTRGKSFFPASRNAFDTVGNPIMMREAQFTQVPTELGLDDLHSGVESPRLVRVRSLGSSVSHSFASPLGSSLARSATPDPQLIGRSRSPGLPPVGARMTNMNMNNVVDGYRGYASPMGDYGDLDVGLSGLSLSNSMFAESENPVQGQLHQELADRTGFPFHSPTDQSLYLPQKSINMSEAELLGIRKASLLANNDLSRKHDALLNVDSPKLASNGQPNLPNLLNSSSFHKKLPSMGLMSAAGPSYYYQGADIADIDFSGCNSNAYSTYHGLPLATKNQLDVGGVDGMFLSRTENQVRPDIHVPLTEQVYAHYLQRSSDLTDPSLGRNFLDSSHLDMAGVLLAEQKHRFGASLGKSGGLNHGFVGSPAFGIGMPGPTSLISGSLLSSMGSVSPLKQNGRLSRFPSMTRSAMGGSTGSWNHENGIMEEGLASSLLEEFKNNKTRSFELSDIVDHVVEFSADQYGSRFIQQKLETASVEEKNKIFPEILPHARALMTDVFGNYVIQKFFEHGTESQIQQLASQLLGHVLPLSLQMYGCRVIQKALEVVDVELQTQMVKELEGSILKCVRDQNGNHVIQKCIECVPQEGIEFIVSTFYGQVVILSTHPYGCRVIQRVLEHCNDEKTQEIMMDEIMQSVCALAQDQYGNYVIQHVLQHGKQEERSAIISKLIGQIVKMSQQKYASNVVEKCLTYGTAEERQRLINEMLGSTDENEPLQAMMKDQFGNYVVQKILETCDDHNRELILSRIKIHLDTLKRYTYGKHIVARVEKLITAGERRIALPPQFS